MRKRRICEDRPAKRKQTINTLILRNPLGQLHPRVPHSTKTKNPPLDSYSFETHPRIYPLLAIYYWSSAYYHRLSLSDNKAAAARGQPSLSIKSAHVAIYAVGGRSVNRQGGPTGAIYAATSKHRNFPLLIPITVTNSSANSDSVRHAVI